MTNWQSIETAPQDGTRILLFIPQRHSAVWIGSFETTEYFLNGKSEGVQAHWVAGLLCTGDDPIPTHWMPLPEPPTS